jgi:hypothetical protein
VGSSSATSNIIKKGLKTILKENYYFKKCIVCLNWGSGTLANQVREVGSSSATSKKGKNNPEGKFLSMSVIKFIVCLFELGFWYFGKPSL